MRAHYQLHQDDALACDIDFGVVVDLDAAGGAVDGDSLEVIVFAGVIGPDQRRFLNQYVKLFAELFVVVLIPVLHVIQLVIERFHEWNRLVIPFLIFPFPGA